jgi:hypothetical protein
VEITVGEIKFTLDDDNEIVAVLEGCVERPVVMSGYLVVSLELFILRWNLWFR